MFPWARYVLNSLKFRNMQQIMTRPSQKKPSTDFHDKYGNTLLIGGSVFSFVGYVFYITQMGIEWNLSPVGRITPKEWKNK